MVVRVRRVPRSFAALAAAAALVSAGQGSSQAAVSPTLYVNYAMNCTFTITSDAGAPVTAIAPGAYQVEISTPTEFAGVDLAGVNDFTACKGSVMFQLTGPGVSLQDTLDNGDDDYDLLSATFKPSSTYVAQDDNQPSVARVVFTTLASGTPALPPATSSAPSTTSSPGSTTGSGAAGATAKADPLRGSLIATISTAGKLTLTNRGKQVSSLEFGRYTIAVTDRSIRDGFIIQQAGKAGTIVTGTSFVGKQSFTIDLKPGRWFFYPTLISAKRHFDVTG